MNNSVKSTLRMNDRLTIVAYMVDGVTRYQSVCDPLDALFEALETTPEEHEGAMIAAWIGMAQADKVDMKEVSVDIIEILTHDDQYIEDTLSNFRETLNAIEEETKYLKREMKKLKKNPEDSDFDPYRLEILLEVQPYFSKGLRLHIAMLENREFCTLKDNLCDIYIKHIIKAENLMDALDIKEGF